MKNCMNILGVALAVCLIVLATAGPLVAATLYYTPVVSAAGDKIAYVKRDYRAWSSGGGIIPFMGGKPIKVRVLKDRILVCVKDLKTGREKVIGNWKPKQVKKSGRIHINPILNWELEDLRYVIKLRADKDPGVGIYRRPYAYLTNLEKWSGLKTGPTEAGTVRVRLDAKVKGRSPKSNAVVIEKTWDLKTGLPVIRQKLDRLIEEQREAAHDQVQQNRVRNLAEFVTGQSNRTLPERLVSLYLDESDRATGTYPDLRPAVVQLGEAAIDPFLQQYDRHPPDTRLAVLEIFAEIGSATALTLVRREIRADNPDLQSAAVVALARIKGDRAGEELALLLSDTRLPSQVRVTALEQLTQTPDIDWPTHVLDTALQDPFIFEQLPDIVPDLGQLPERMIWFRLPKIYEYLESKNSRSVRTAQHLVARIRFWNHLSELGPVVEDLLKARYDYGRTTDAAGNLTDTGSDPTDERVVWERGLATEMLDNIEEKLEHPSMWMPRNLKQADNLLKLLYLEELLYKRKGQRIINRPPVEAQFEVSVLDAAGSVQAAGRRFVEVGRQVTLQGEPVTAGFPTPICTGRLVIDKDNWRLTFKPMIVRLADRTKTVAVSIPFGGACEIKMTARLNGKPELITWTLRHIDTPRQR
jgi:hypothetical protein